MSTSDRCVRLSQPGEYTIPTTAMSAPSAMSCQAGRRAGSPLELGTITRSTHMPLVPNIILAIGKALSNCGLSVTRRTFLLRQRFKIGPAYNRFSNVFLEQCSIHTGSFGDCAFSKISHTQGFSEPLDI